MSHVLKQALLVFCICFCLAGCSDPEAATPPDTQPTAAAVTEETAAETLPPSTVPEALPQTEPAETEPTEPIYEAGEERDPVLPPPVAEEGPCHYYDDAAFIGDSISYTLFLHHTKTGDFGDALFFVRGSLGIHNTLNNMLQIYYQGQDRTPWDALAVSGVKKVFIMLGTNDIGYYGIDATMEMWETYLKNIRESCPDIEVHIQALTPMWSEAAKGILNNENIDLYNQRLKEFAEENDCYFLDATPYLKDSTGSLARPYCNDFYVHMNYEGTAVWANFLKNYGAEMEKENP